MEGNIEENAMGLEEFRKCVVTDTFLRNVKTAVEAAATTVEIIDGAIEVLTMDGPTAENIDEEASQMILCKDDGAAHFLEELREWVERAAETIEQRLNTTSAVMSEFGVSVRP